LPHEYREKLGDVVMPYDYRAPFTNKRCLIVSWSVICARGVLKEDEWHVVKLTLKDNARVVCLHTRVHDTISSCKDSKAYQEGRKSRVWYHCTGAH